MKKFICLILALVLALSSAFTVNAKSKKIKKYYTKQDVVMLAKTAYAEAGGLNKYEQACVMWCILNRVDKYHSSIKKVVTAPYQFAYHSYSPTTKRLYNLAKDVLKRWNREKNGKANARNSGRVLPKKYIYFSGNGRHNNFRTSYNNFSNYYTYYLKSPYKK